MKGKLPFVLFFIYLVLQGALRKWWMPSLGTPLYLLQYAILYWVYLTVPRGLNQPKITPAFQGLLTAFLGYCILEMMNLRGTSNLIVQVYGFLMVFSFVPLLYLLPRILSDEETFQTYLKWLSFILIPVFMLGVTQYFSSQEAFVNRYATDALEGEYEVAIGTGSKVRITGTFSYLATYASFLCFILHLLFYGTIVSLFKKKLNWYFAVAYGMGVVNLFMTQSRGASIYYAGTEVAVLVIMTLSGQAKFLNNIIPLAAMFVGGYFIILATEAGSSAMTDFLARLLGVGDIESRLDDSFSPFKYADLTGPLGYGIGTAQFPMSSYLTNRWEMPGYWEEEGERIAIELGTLGYLLVMFLRWVTFFSCFQVYRGIKTLEFKILALIMTMYQLPFLINLQTNIFNYIDGIFYWMAIGLVYFARVLDQKRREKEQLENKEHNSLTLP